MKRTMLIGLSVLVCATFAIASTNEVTSVNVVGYNKTTLLPGGKYHQVAPPFDAMTTNTVMGIFGTNTLRSSVFPASCDLVYIWNAAAQVYTVVGLKAGDHLYHSVTNFAGPAVDPEIGPGDGVWVTTPSAQAATNTFALIGEVVASSNQQQVVIAGFQMLGVPFSCAMPITNLNFQASGATASGFPTTADAIYVWDPSGSQYIKYALKTTGWRQVSPVNHWADGVATGDQIPLGQGFWYQAINPFTWTIVNPYLNNL